MKSCDGPCEQGRRKCPRPWACEVQEPPEYNPLKVVFIDAAIATIVIVSIAVIVWRAL